MKKITKKSKEEFFKIKDLYVGQIVAYYGQKMDKNTTTNLTMQTQKAAILTQVEPFSFGSSWFVPFGYKSLKTNTVYRPLSRATLGNYALNDKSLKSFKNYFPEIIKKYNLSEESELSLSQIINLENQENRNFNLENQDDLVL